VLTRAVVAIALQRIHSAKSKAGGVEWSGVLAAEQLV
jgi:hypothetical protein